MIIISAPDDEARSSAEKSPSNPPQQNPRVPWDQCLIVHGLPEARVDNGSLETRHDIDELSKVIKHNFPPGEVIIILETHCLGPRVSDLPYWQRDIKPRAVTFISFFQSDC